MQLPRASAIRWSDKRMNAAGARVRASYRRTSLATCRAASDDHTPVAHTPVAIVGAGIAGLALAAALRKVGIRSVVLEKGSALREEGAAIGLWSNAWKALEALDVADALRPGYLPLSRVELCRSTGRTLKAFSFAECDDGKGQEFRGVPRVHLLRALLAQLPEDSVQFGVGVASIDVPSSSPSNSGIAGKAAVLQLEDGRRLSCDLLVGADGSRSVVASRLQVPEANYAGYVAYRGLATFPDGLPLPQDTIRQIWGAGVRAGLYPVTPTQCYWYTCFNAPAGAPAPATEQQRQQEALAAVPGWAWQVEDCIRATPTGGLSRGRIVDRWTLQAPGQGCITLIGDAAHPMTPNLGQGGCTALEDSVVLARMLRNAGSLGSARESSNSTQLESVLRSFEQLRIKRCLPLTVRSWAFGFALQLPQPLVTALRDEVVANLFSPAHFLDHTSFDCGRL